MRYATLKVRAERHAIDELGWPNAQAIEARGAGRDGRAVAVLVDPGVHGGDPFVIAFDEWDEIATDAGLPAEFGWGETDG